MGVIIVTPQGQVQTRFLPPRSHLSSNVHPGIDEIDNNLHSVRLSGQLTKTRASAKHLKEQVTHSIPYI